MSKEDKIFSYIIAILFGWILGMITMNIPGVMKSTHTYKDLQENWIIEERQENIIIIRE